MDATGKKRLVGLLLLVAILAVFLSLNRFPKLDTVREDLDVVMAPKVECFQGFCIEAEDDSTLLERWWSFSTTYLRLVAAGMIFAFAVAGLTEGFLLPERGRRDTVLSGSRLSRTLKGLAVGPVMNLCSACIVPVAASFRRRGAGIEGAISMVHGSSTLNLPALIMVAFVFTPLLGFSRLLLSIVAALAVGPLVAMVAARRRGEWDQQESPVDIPAARDDRPWAPVLREAFVDWARSSLGFLVRMGPIMIVAGFASGLVIQFIDPESVSTYLGNDVPGILVAATLGILINVPLLFEIPLVALLLLLGMGVAPAAALLFTAAAGGPVTFWGLAGAMPKRAIATLAASTWVIGVVGGLGLLAYDLLASEHVGGLAVDRVEAAIDPQFEAGDAPFIDRSGAAGIDFHHTSYPGEFFAIGGGVVVLDYDNDGFHDVYVSNSVGPSALYRNDGDGTFRDMAAAAGVDDPAGRGNGGCAADYDNDGDSDLYVTNYGRSRLFSNNGNGTFADVSASTIGDYETEKRYTGCAWGDYDRDGYLDLVVVSHVSESADIVTTRSFYLGLAGLSLYHNERDGTLANVTHLLGDTAARPIEGNAGNIFGAGFQPGWLDFDNDGDLDLYVVNDVGREVHPNVLWRNDGAGPGNGWKFTDASMALGAQARMDGMGLAVGDYDLDGSLDMFMTNINDNVLLRNNADGTGFTDATDDAGVGSGKIGLKIRISWGTFFFDYDNDGDEDLYVASGYLGEDLQPANPRQQPNLLLRNERDGTFLDVSSGSGTDDPGVGRGAAFLDYNNDGCLDLLLANYGQASRLLQNRCDSGNHWIIVNVRGTASNRDGIGSRITLIAGDSVQIREVSAGGSQMGQNMPGVHFGLGEADTVDSLTIRWPSGNTQTIVDVPADQRIDIVETDLTSN